MGLLEAQQGVCRNGWVWFLNKKKPLQPKADMKRITFLSNPRLIFQLVAAGVSTW